jgi:hypothetical protein
MAKYYPNLKTKALEAARAREFATMTKAERQAYGAEVGRAVLALQHCELYTIRTRIDPRPAAVKYQEAMRAKMWNGEG